MKLKQTGAGISVVLAATIVISAAAAFTAEASSIRKTEKLTNYKSEDPIVITTCYSENGLWEKTVFENEDITVTPEYAFDENGTVSDIKVMYSQENEDLNYELKLENTYEGDELTKVNGTFYTVDGEEVEDISQFEDLQALIIEQQEYLTNYDAYANCTVSFAGLDTYFTKTDGEILTSKILEEHGYYLLYEYEQPGYVNKITYSTPEGDTSLSFEYDELGRLGKVLSEGGGDSEEHTFSYKESEDENGNTVYEDTEDFGFKYVFDADGKLLNREQRNTSFEKVYYDEEERLTCKETSYIGKKPVMVREYEYY